MESKVEMVTCGPSTLPGQSDDRSGIYLRSFLNKDLLKVAIKGTEPPMLNDDMIAIASIAVLHLDHPAR